jgi:hypothetical protein
MEVMRYHPSFAFCCIIFLMVMVYIGNPLISNIVHFKGIKEANEKPNEIGVMTVDQGCGELSYHGSEPTDEQNSVLLEKGQYGYLDLNNN